MKKILISIATILLLSCGTNVKYKKEEEKKKQQPLDPCKNEEVVDEVKSVLCF